MANSRDDLWKTALGPTPRLQAGDGIPGISVAEYDLVILEGPDRGKRFSLKAGLTTVGKDPTNEVVLSDINVSRQHLSIEPQDTGFLLKDMGSTNGTWVNGVRTREAFVAPQSTITIGATTLRLDRSEKFLAVTPGKARFGELVGQNPRMRELFGYIERVAKTELSVLLQGESGTGKEMFARALHQASPRSKAPLVVFDCGSVEPALVGSALFGHRAGAFTGANESRKGAFASAHTGTLFLDEVGELPLDLQPRLLRILETRELQAVGSDAVTKVDVRVVAATHRNLSGMVEDGRFRLDLLYRLSGLVLTIPPLRERAEDIVPLAQEFLTSVNPAARLTSDACALLAAHPWRGNVRELKNVIRRAAALASSAEIHSNDLIFDGPERPKAPELAARTPAPAPPCSDDASSARNLDDVEKDAIVKALREAGWHKGKACELLGVSYRTLRNRIRKYGLKPS
jgi:transcriptional regulator with GAF, ATPase, and Fis domain